MRLVPKEWDQYNPILVLIGAVFLVGGGYGLIIPGPPIIWLIRAIFAIPAAIGSIILIRQVQLWRKRRIRKYKREAMR